MALSKAKEGCAMSHIKTLTTLTAVGLLGAGLLNPVAAAEETYYFQGTPWELLLTQPEGADAKPACVLRTTAWPSRSLSIETRLIGVDKIARGLRIRKTGWNLPVGKTTQVKVGVNFLSPAPHELDVISPEELYVSYPEDEDGAIGIALATSFAFSPKLPSAMALKFEGNEQPWIIPAINKRDYYALNEGLNDCDVALKQLGPKLFSSEDEATSPFAAPPKTDASASSTPTAWEFSRREEDWGETCYAEKKNGGDVTIGFMKARGHDLEGFIENGSFSGIVKSSWKVDNEPPVSSEGEPNDYFGWHSFSGFKTAFVDQMISGQKTLTITDDKGTVITTDLDGALGAFWQLNACLEDTDR
ncbi:MULTISPECIES: hypothetical protein [Agrobacterium]|uniref:hypothetical protein n=1 Tax=Agrobacterium TaxID=357 RepID=UPI0012E3F90E|nr:MULTISPECIES: hypothetical protein [Agrobacterium]